MFFMQDITPEMRVDDQFSDKCSVSSGVPHGTVMGPLLLLT